MKILTKYLKPFAGIILLCFVLLCGQAASDLALPTLMSNIVTYGIQYGGIDEALPEALSSNAMDFVTAFMKEEDVPQFKDAYEYVNQGTENEKFPEIKKEGGYLLKKIDEKLQNELAASYGKAIFAFTSFAKQNGMMEENKSSMDQDQQMDPSQLYKILPMIKQMPKETLENAKNAAELADPSMYQMVGGGFTRLFYEELGSDMDAIQNSYILRTGAKMLLVTLLGVFAAILVGFFASRTGAKVAQMMRRDVFSKVESFSNAEYDQFSTASLITRTTNDVQQVQMLIVMGIRMLCYAPILGIGGIIFAFNRSVSLSWIIALAVLCVILIVFVLFSIAMPRFKALQKLIDRLNLVTRENLSGMLVIRAFGNEHYEEKRFAGANNELSKTNRFVQRTISFMFPAMMLVMNLVTIAIVWSASHLIAESNLALGDMMAFLQYAMQIIMAFLMIAMMFIMVPRAAVSAKRIQEVLETKLTINDKENCEKLVHPRGEIQFNDVSFRYKNAESDVLEHLSFTAHPGETTAIIGATGAGKSTLINLIPRFYDVTQGSITFDGIDIRDLSQKELREAIGFVPQKGILFSGDIASNIRYGNETATEDEVLKSIEVAQAKDYLSSCENGLSTDIAQGGTNVSGGQKQRLSIARALIKKPPVYIFDDSFSALDFKTDAALRKALKEFTADATVLIVAQRVSTIMHAEQIIVLEEGKIVGLGTHHELLKNCPTYREIAESQLSKEELA